MSVSALLFFKILLAILSSLHFHVNFRICLSIKKKKERQLGLLIRLHKICGTRGVLLFLTILSLLLFLDDDLA